MTDIHFNLTSKDLRKFGVVMAIAFGIIGLIPAWKDHWTISYVFWGISVILFLLPALIYPMFLRPIHKYWMKFAMAVGWFNSRLILSLMFYLIFTPIAIFMKIIGRDPLERRYLKESDSYWVDRSKEEINPKHFERQF